MFHFVFASIPIKENAVLILRATKENNLSKSFSFAEPTTLFSL